MSSVRPVKISMRSESRWKALWTLRISTSAIGSLVFAEGLQFMLRCSLRPPAPASPPPADPPRRPGPARRRTGPRALRGSRRSPAPPAPAADSSRPSRTSQTTLWPSGSRTAAAGRRNRGGPAARRAAPLRTLSSRKSTRGAHLRQDPRIAIDDAHLDLHRGALAVGGGHHLPDLTAERGVGIGVERDPRGAAAPAPARCTPRSRRPRPRACGGRPW